MPRIPRGAIPGQFFHIFNRGNGRARLFHDEEDFADFVYLLGKARIRFGLPLFAFAIMPNHFHLVAQAPSALGLSSFMQWWLTSHVRRFHKRYGTSGHVWQGRFRSFPIQEGEHLLTVLRYVLLNPVRAELVATAAEWRWCSLRHPRLISSWPVVPARDLASWLSDGLSPNEVAAVRDCIRKRTPYGDDAWRERLAAEAGLPPRAAPQRRGLSTARPKLVAAPGDGASAPSLLTG